MKKIGLLICALIVNALLMQNCGSSPSQSDSMPQNFQGTWSENDNAQMNDEDAIYALMDRSGIISLLNQFDNAYEDGDEDELYNIIDKLDIALSNLADDPTIDRSVYDGIVQYVETTLSYYMDDGNAADYGNDDPSSAVSDFVDGFEEGYNATMEVIDAIDELFNLFEE